MNPVVCKLHPNKATTKNSLYTRKRKKKKRRKERKKEALEPGGVGAKT